MWGFNSDIVLGVSIVEPFSVTKVEFIPQSSRCSLSQMLLIFKTFESPLVTKVSAAVSSIDVEPALSVSSRTVPSQFTAGIKAIA